MHSIDRETRRAGNSELNYIAVGHGAKLSRFFASHKKLHPTGKDGQTRVNFWEGTLLISGRESPPPGS